MLNTCSNTHSSKFATEPKLQIGPTLHVLALPPCCQRHVYATMQQLRQQQISR
jgi:hypothetical protein